MSTVDLQNNCSRLQLIGMHGHESKILCSFLLRLNCAHEHMFELLTMFFFFHFAHENMHFKLMRIGFGITIADKQ